MLVAIYGKPRQLEPTAVARGCEALGYRCVWRHHGSFDASGDFFPEADAAVTFGQRLHSARIAETYRQAGIPVLTVDLPPLRVARLGSHTRALWLNRVNWIPDGPLPTDRWQNFGIPFREHRAGSAGVLLCGQTEDDAAHRMDAKAIREWALSTATAAGEFHRVTWRPHPQCRFSLDGFAQSNPDEPIEEVLERDWHAVVTYNSTVGLTAILTGLSIFCSPASFYAEIANVSLAGLGHPTFPDTGRLLRFFSRLAYAQWTFEELGNGEAVRFVLEQARKLGE